MKVFKRVLSLMLVFCLLFTSSFSYAAMTDENNVTGGTSNPDGAASSGNASYTSSSQMWKISVYVAKKDTVTNSSSYTLTNDYHKFGYTFWLYRDDYGLDQLNAAGIDKSKLLFELGNKEEYVNGGASFQQAKYSSISGRIFKGSENGLVSGNNVVPLINGLGASSIEDTQDFFDSNKPVSNALVELAAKAAGSSVEALLKSLTFTINGETKSNWALNMVDVRFDSDGEHTSCVSWVFLYEPVIVINSTAVTGYYHAVTATGIAAAMIQGIYNFTSSATDYTRRFKTTTVPSPIPAKWGLGTNFPLVTMPNTCFLSEDWLGYKTGTYWQTWNGGSTWYVESQLAGGGFGLRYQRADLPKVVIQKTVNGSTSGTLSGFTFTVTSNSTGEVWESKTDSSGKVTLYLPAGTYTISEPTITGYEHHANQTFVVGASATTVNVTLNNTSIPSYSSFYIAKVAEDGDYSDTSFTMTSEDGKWIIDSSILDVSETNDTNETVLIYSTDGRSKKINVKIYDDTTGGVSCRRIRLQNLPAETWTVTETCPDRYTTTFVGASPTTQTEGLSTSVDVAPAGSTYLRFDNLLLTKGTLEITKEATDNNFTDTTFTIESEDWNTSSSFNLTVGETVITLKNSSGQQIKANVAVTEAVDGDITTRKITVSGLPAGTWTVTETCPERYEKTFAGETKEAALAGADDATSCRVTVTEDLTTAVYFVNQLDVKGSITIVKTAQDNVIEGVTFVVTDNTTGETATYTTDASGVISIDGIVGHEYTVSESSVPERYVAPESQTATLTEDEALVFSFENKLRCASLTKIYKECQDATATDIVFSVSGAYTASFELEEGLRYVTFTSEDGTHTLDLLTRTFLRDKVFYIWIYNLPIGEYTVTETCPDRYLRTSVGTIYVLGSEVTAESYDLQEGASASFVNDDSGYWNSIYFKNELPSFVFKKLVDGYNGGSGFEFTFVNDETGEEYVFTTDSDSMCRGIIPDGTYTVTETTQMGFEIYAPFTITVDSTSTTYEKKLIRNSTIDIGSLLIRKTVTDSKLANITVTLSNEEYGELSFNLATLPSAKWITLTALDGIRQAKIYVRAAIGTDDEGNAYKEISVSYLPAGTWTVTETCPERYLYSYVGAEEDELIAGSATTVKVTKGGAGTVYFRNEVPEATTLTVSKEIELEDIVWAHGTPTFFISVYNVNTAVA